MDSSEKAKLIERVEQAIDTIRPYLEQDGGDITVEDIGEDFMLKVRLHGACSSCSMSMMTLQAGVAEAVRHAVPEISGVVAVNMPLAEA
ncbi:MAG: NifU family protein [Bacteroidia bacterium]|nr:NifU family protein [Bacteroidia bacterium]MCC6767945.1 NifU family protein [Bacteroidia bacterium]